MDNKKRLKNDVILVSILILIPVFLLALNIFTESKDTPDTVTISVDGKLITSAPLAEDSEFDILSEEGINHVIIRNGKVWVSYADCPDKICVNHKPVSECGEQIVCLPHRVVIEIISGSNREIDSLSE